MKKIAILNDIHSNLYLLTKILEQLKNQAIDLYIINGDFLTDGPDSNRILEELKKLSCVFVVGNREENIINLSKEGYIPIETYYPLYYTTKSLNKDNINFLMKLPRYKILEIENTKICISHGTPYDTVRKVNKEDEELFDKLINDFHCDIYLFAHSHESFDTTYRDVLFINAGAVNCYLSKALTSSYGILKVSETHATYELIEFDINYKELKSYYVNSMYYKANPEWSMIILNKIKYAKDYATMFIEEYNNTKNFAQNYKDFKIKYSLEEK